MTSQDPFPVTGQGNKQQRENLSYCLFCLCMGVRHHFKIPDMLSKHDIERLVTDKESIFEFHPSLTLNVLYSYW